MRRSGFTLLELVVVLGILSAMTFLLTTQFAGVQHERRYERSNADLRTLLLAIAGDPLAPAGTAPAFVSDLGRLPVALTNSQDESELTLLELVRKPLLAAPYGFYQAEGRLCKGARRQGLVDRPMDANVCLAMGWRGPYLNLPPGAEEPFFRDGWGNPAVSANAAVPPSGEEAPWPDRLLGEDWTGGAAYGGGMTNGTPIAFIRHLGADGLPAESEGGESAFDRDVVVAPVSNAFVTSLSGYVEVPTNATTLVIRLYGPPPAPTDPADATSVMVWEWKRRSLSYVSGQRVPFSLTNNAARMTAGRRVLRSSAYRGDHEEIRFSVPHQVVLAPGANVLPFPLVNDQIRP